MDLITFAQKRANELKVVVHIIQNRKLSTQFTYIDTQFVNDSIIENWIVYHTIVPEHWSK